MEVTSSYIRCYNRLPFVTMARGSVHTDASGDDGYPSIVHSMRLVVASQGIQDSENTIALLLNVICLVHKFNSVGRVCNWVGTTNASICGQYCIDDPIANQGLITTTIGVAAAYMLFCTGLVQVGPTIVTWFHWNASQDHL